jgi:hypothetical protein
MPDIMKQSRDPHGKRIVVRYLIFAAQPVKDPSRQMKRPEAMSKSRMLRRLIRKKRQPQLPHPPQPLKLPRINQPPHQLAPIPGKVNPDNIMNRIAVIPFQRLKSITLSPLVTNPYIFGQKKRPPIDGLKGVVRTNLENKTETKTNASLRLISGGSHKVLILIRRFINY